MLNILDKKLIVINANIKTDEECIKLGGKLLKENGYVSNGYTAAVLKREKEFPTGLKGEEFSIAIPHTENTFVNSPAVACIVPKESVQFRAMGMPDVFLDCKVIFPLVVKDSKMQVLMLKKMMQIIQNTELLRKILQAKTKSEVLVLLSSLNSLE